MTNLLFCCLQQIQLVLQLLVDLVFPFESIKHFLLVRVEVGDAWLFLQLLWSDADLAKFLGLLLYLLLVVFDFFDGGVLLADRLPIRCLLSNFGHIYFYLLLLLQLL